MPDDISRKNLPPLSELIAICGGSAWGLVHFAGIDPLTAYLATSPGGADSVAILSASAQQLAAYSILMPNLNGGASYHGHSGNLQRSTGQILNVSSQSAIQPMPMMIPYTAIVLVTWIIFFVVWYLVGIPWGPSAPVHLS